MFIIGYELLLSVPLLTNAEVTCRAGDWA